MNKRTNQQIVAERSFAAGASSRDAEVAELRQQVTMLRRVMNRIAFSRTGQCTDIAQELFSREEWAAEALAATEPKP